MPLYEVSLKMVDGEELVIEAFRADVHESGALLISTAEAGGPNDYDFVIAAGHWGAMMVLEEIEEDVK